MRRVTVGQIEAHAQELRQRCQDPECAALCLEVLARARTGDPYAVALVHQVRARLSAEVAADDVGALPAALAAFLPPQLVVGLQVVEAASQGIAWAKEKLAGVKAGVKAGDPKAVAAHANLATAAKMLDAQAKAPAKPSGRPSHVEVYAPRGRRSPGIGLDHRDAAIRALR